MLETLFYPKAEKYRLLADERQKKRRERGVRRGPNIFAEDNSRSLKKRGRHYEKGGENIGKR